MADAKHIQVYDTTLRDGCQSEDVSLTVEDKVDDRRASRRPRFRLHRGRMAGLERSRRRVLQGDQEDQVSPRQDRGLRLDSPRRSSRRGRSQSAVDPAQPGLRSRPWSARPGTCMSARRCESRSNENLEILNDTIAFLKKNFDEAIFDAEHFFDGYFHNPEYALACLKAVDDAGVDADRAVRHQRRTPAGRNRSRGNGGARRSQLPDRNPLS